MLDRMTAEIGDSDPKLAEFRRSFLEAKSARIPHEKKRRLCVDYFHSKQLDGKMLDTLKKRGQPPIVLNEIQPTVNALTGLFRAQKLDFACDPVGKDDEQSAEFKQHLLKYLVDDGQLEYIEPQLADDMAIGGKGFLLIDAKPSGYGMDFTRLKASDVYVDPYATEYDMNKDARYIDISKWLTLKQFKDAYPKFAKQADDYVSRRDLGRDDDADSDEARTVLKDPFGPSADWLPWFGEFVDHDRLWIRVVEHWYRVDEMAGFMNWAGEETELTEDFDYTDAHLAAITEGEAEVYRRITKRIRKAVWTCDMLIEDKPSPHDSDKYPIIRWAGYITEDGDQQGIVHALLDPQDVINKSFSKSTWHRMANLLFAETGIFPAGINRVRDEINKPDGVIEVKPGMLEKFKVDRGSEAIAAEIEVLNFAINRLRRISGINEEMRGENSRAESRVAIDAKREQSYGMQGVLFDHRNWSWVILGETLLSYAPRYCSAAFSFRVTNDDRTKTWVQANKRVIDETGNVILENDVSEGRAKVKVVDAPMSDTQREVIVDLLNTAISALPPDMAAQVAHLPVMLMKLPDYLKAEFKAVADSYKERINTPAPVPEKEGPKVNISVPLDKMPGWVQEQGLANIGIEAPGGPGTANMSSEQSKDAASMAEAQFYHAEAMAVGPDGQPPEVAAAGSEMAGVA